jgi:DNA-binding transcriptional LysR family regulator
MDLDIRLIRSFVAVAETLSFTKASDMVQVNQPQMSNRIRALEQQVGFRLFDRSSREVRLTAHGMSLLPHARRLLDEHEALARIASDIKFGISSTLRLGFLDYFQPLRRRIVSNYMKRHPDDVIEVESTSYPGALAAMRAGQLDLAFMSLPDTQVLPADYESIELASAPLGLLLPAAAAPAGATELTAADLQRRSIALFRRELSPELYDEIAQLMSHLAVRVTRLPEASEAGLVDFVRNTGQPAACAQWWMLEEDRPEGLVHRVIPELAIHFRSLLVRPRARSSPAGERLWRMVQRSVSGGPASRARARLAAAQPTM